MSRHASRRSALSLLEVVLALAILAGSFATLAQLVGLGMRAAGESRDLAQAQLLADSVMSEFAAGVLPVEAVNRIPFDSYPGWLVSTALDATVHSGMVRVTVLVERDSQSLRSARFQVSRWIRDPTLALPTETSTTSGSPGTGSSANSKIGRGPGAGLSQASGSGSGGYRS